ncbi:MAG: NusG domain II-containing protein [Emergencia sp.]
MFKVIKKADIILFIVLVAASLAVTAAALSGGDEGERVRISVDGKTYGVYSLYEDRTVEIKQDKSINKITIKDGHVQMSDSTCRNQVCVDTGEISRTSQSIVCLPNKVMVEIVGGEANLDAVSK